MLAEMKETEVDIEAVAEKALADSELLSEKLDNSLAFC